MELIIGKIRIMPVPMPMPFFNLLGAGFNPSENLNSQKSKDMKISKTCKNRFILFFLMAPGILKVYCLADMETI